MKTLQQIIKGLECCVSGWCERDKCPYSRFISPSNKCREDLRQDALKVLRDVENNKVIEEEW